MHLYSINPVQVFESCCLLLAAVLFSSITGNQFLCICRADLLDPDSGLVAALEFTIAETIPKKCITDVQRAVLKVSSSTFMFCDDGCFRTIQWVWDIVAPPNIVLFVIMLSICTLALSIRISAQTLR